MNSITNHESGKDSLVRSPRAQFPSRELSELFSNLDDAPGLRDFFDILRRRRVALLIVFLCILVPTVIYNFVVQPIFQAQGWLELSVASSRVTKFEEIADPFEEGEDFLQTQLGLMQSTALARRVAERVHLADHPLFNPQTKGDEEEGLFTQLKNLVLSAKRRIQKTIQGWLKPDGWKSGLVDQELMQLSKQKALEGYITSNLTVTPQDKANIVTIAFNSEDPTLARNVVNSLIQEFIDWQMDRRVDATRTAKRQLEKQITVARNDLESVESEFNRFAKENGIVSLDSKMNIIYQELEQINANFAQIEASRIIKEQNYKYAANNDLSSIPLIQQSALIQELRQQYLTLRAEYEKLDVRYKEEFPTVKAIRAQIAEIDSKIKSEQQRILHVVKNDYLSTVMAEQALQASAKEKKALALNLNDVASRYKIFEREVDVNKQIYQSLLERSKEIDANVGTDLTNIKVVDLATLPLETFEPKVARNLILAVVLGLLAGIGFALVIEHMDDSIRRIDEISRRYWIPVLGVVPKALKSEQQGLLLLLSSKPSSAFSEAIRMIRVSIQKSNTLPEPVKSLLLTSSRKGEGKSTLSANLAQAFAASKEKVLLMEADLRRPSLQRVFSDNGNSRGLSEYLGGSCKYEEIVQRTTIPNLYFIGAGGISFNSTELLTSQKMKKLLETVAGHFDRVIVDGPPFCSDALALGNQVNGIILVATLGQTHREGLRVFREGLDLVQARLLGGVVNMLDAAAGYNGSAYYGSYYKGYEHLPKGVVDTVQPPVNKESQRS